MTAAPPIAATPGNPYMGPVSFDEKQSDRYFGRSDEIRELTSLVIARRAVLLYAQSGAGKTSLIKAGLIPELKRREQFEILPISRVVGASEPGAGNIYAANAIANLDPGSSAGNLKDALYPILAADPTPHLLIFDQFEEIFTNHPELHEHRRAFFEQLNECLNEFPQLTLLLSMREDYLAGLDSYVGYLPDRMRTRMRMERLKRPSAVAGVSGPAAQAGKPFAKGVAEELVDNLRRIQTSAVDGPRPLGEYVEPVQLQIVCWQLWSKLPAGATSITAADVEQHANVDDALTRFYTGALAKAQEAAGISERVLRQWFGQQLITPARTRGLVYRGAKDTAGLPNAAVESLDRSYVIRGNERGEDKWCELTHDRLVEPILQSNEKWRAGYRNPVADGYEPWVAGGRDPGKLLNGNQLAEARRFAVEHPEELTPDEKKFLETSDKAAFVRKRNWILVAGLTAAVLFALATLLLMARSAQRVAEDALLQAKISEGKATKAQGLAQTETLKATLALVQNDIDTARGRVRDGRIEEALPYLARALRNEPESPIAQAWIYDLLRGVVWFRGRALKEVGSTLSVTFSPDRRRLAIVSTEGSVRVYDTKTGRATGGKEPYLGSTAAFSSDSNRMVTTSSKAGAGVILWDLRPGVPEEGKAISGSPGYRSAVFSPDDKDILTAGSSGVEVIDAMTGVRRRVPPQGPIRGAKFASYSPKGGKILIVPEKGAEIWEAASPKVTVLKDKEVYAAAFAPDGAAIATVSSAGIQIWDAATGDSAGPHIGDASISGEYSQIRSVAFSPDGARLVTAVGTTIEILAQGGNARVWDTVTGAQVGQTLVHTAGLDLYSAAFTPDGRQVVTSGLDGVQFWDEPAPHPAGVSVPVRYADAADMSFIAVSGDGRRVVTPAEDGCQVWDALTGKPVPGGKLKSGDRSWPAFSPDGRLIVTVGPTLRQWDAETFAPVGPAFEYKGKPLMTAQFSQDGRRLLTRASDKIWVWDTATGKPAGPAFSGAGIDYASLAPDGLRVVTSPENTEKGVARIWEVASGRSKQLPDSISAEFAPDGRRLFEGSVKGLRTRDVTTFEPIPGSPLAGNNPIAWVRLSPDGRFLATVPDYKSAQVLEVATGQTIGQPLRQEGAVSSVVFSPDGRLVAIGADEGGSQIWDVRTGKSLRRRLRHDSYVLPIKFTPDSRRAIAVESANYNYSAHIWDLFPPGGEAAAKALADLAEVVAGALGAPVSLSPEQRQTAMRGLVAQSPQLDPEIAGLIRRFAAILDRPAAESKKGGR